MKTKSFITVLTFVLLFFITACEKDSATPTKYSYIKYEYSFLHTPLNIHVTTSFYNSDSLTHIYGDHNPIRMEFTTGLVKKGFEAKMKTIISYNISSASEFNITQNIYGSTDGNNFKLIKSKFTNILPKDSAEISYIVE
jgi:curli biogenesis system outer membrane secretion channel CsgG